jgi:alkylation response protein AidB-like acyl-CoA dehydrogenase
MSLVYDDDERMLRDAAREFLAAEAPVAALRKLRDERDASGFSRTLWAKMAEMGWAGILVPEAHGGLGFSHAGAGILCEQMGRTLTASPFFASSVLGASLIRLAGSAGQQSSLLPRVARGACLLALAIDESPRHDPLAIATRATPLDGGFVLHGAKRLVLDGHVADTLIVVARTAGKPGVAHGITLFLVDPREQGVVIERSSLVDSRNAANVRFDDVRLGTGAVLGAAHEGAAPLERALDIGRICLAAELLGIATEAFERTLDYLRQRKQFGRLIGEFQALQHRAARLFCELELARSAVLRALRAIDEPDTLLAPLASLAKARANDVATLAVNEGVQLHGGIGMTDEFELGFFMKRAGAARTLLGDSYHHIDRYALKAGF